MVRQKATWRSDHGETHRLEPVSRTVMKRGSHGSQCALRKALSSSKNGWLGSGVAVVLAIPIIKSRTHQQRG